MKYLKTFETQQTPSDILDLFTDRIQNIILDDYELQVQRTKGSYKIVIIDNNKIIARLYLQDIKKKGDKFYAEVRRVHVNDEYRDKGLGSKLMQSVIDIFGDFNLYLYPSPNRIKNLNNQNKEEYRNRLVNFYGKYGFKKVGDSNRMERYL